MQAIECSPKGYVYKMIQYLEWAEFTVEGSHSQSTIDTTIHTPSREGSISSKPRPLLKARMQERCRMSNVSNNPELQVVSGQVVEASNKLSPERQKLRIQPQKELKNLPCRLAAEPKYTQKYLECLLKARARNEAAKLAYHLVSSIEKYSALPKHGKTRIGFSLECIQQSFESPRRKLRRRNSQMRDAMKITKAPVQQRKMMSLEVTPREHAKTAHTRVTENFSQLRRKRCITPSIVGYSSIMDECCTPWSIQERNPLSFEEVWL